VPQPLGLSQQPSLALASLTTTTTSGYGPPQTLESSGQHELASDPLPAWLAAQPERVDLPTERDIIGDMDIGGLLGTWTRPRAKLVPQPREPGGGIVELGPGESDDPAARRSEPGTFRATPHSEVGQHLIISPVEGTILGPFSSPESATPDRRRSQGHGKPSDRIPGQSSRGSADLPPAGGGIGAQLVPVPATLPKKEPRGRVRTPLLMLPVLLGGLVYSAFSCSQIPRIKRSRRSMVTVT
jgi:hypothetical protein